jgi:exonuclease III
MIIETFNIRGLGSRVKRRKVREFISSEKFDFLAIQETKMEACSDSFCHGLWGNDGCDWVALPAVGNSKGILSLWNKAIASRVFHFSGE